MTNQEKLTALQLEGWTVVKEYTPLKTLGIIVQKDNEFWSYEFGGKTHINGHFTLEKAYTKQFKKSTT